MASPLSDIVDAIQSGAFLFEDLKRFRFCNDELAHDLPEAKVAEFIMVLCGVFIAMNHVETVKNSVPELIIAFQEELSKIWNNITEHQSFAINDNNVHSRPSTFKTGTAGRPKLEINSDQIRSFRKLGFSWTKIASVLGISRRSLYRRRHEFDVESFNEISDADLDLLVQEILMRAPNSGERLMIGSLRSRGLRIQRKRIRESILRVDPVSRLMRRRGCIKRRQYNVPGVNYLWLVTEYF